MMKTTLQVLVLVAALTAICATVASAVNLEVYPNTSIYGRGDSFRVDIWCGSYGYRWAIVPAGRAVRWTGLPTRTGCKIRVTSLSGVAAPAFFDDWVNTGTWPYGTIRRTYNFRY